MGVFLDAQETIFRYGEYMEEFQSAFKSNDMSFGSPDDFFALSKDLKADDSLRAELAKPAKSLIEKENNKISLRTVLTIIAVSSGGPEITNSKRDMSKPINTLIGFLTNAVGCRDLNPDHLDSMCLATSIRNSASDPELASSQLSISDETPKNKPQAEPRDLPSESPSLSAENITDFKELLARLELNAMEVKLHLDSIDQRISRMEPLLENIMPRVTPSSERLHRSRHLQRQESNSRPFAPTNLQEPEPASEELLLHRSEIRGVPFESYEDPPSFFQSGMKVFIVFILLGLAISVSVFLYRHRSDQYLSRTYEYLQERFSALRQPHVSASGTRTPANAPAATPAPGTAIKPANETAPPAVAPIPAETSATRVDKNPTPVQPEPATAESASLPAARVDVSSSAMTANLISAPKPIYPKFAQQNHMQGRVILQGTVNGDGAIEDLHAVKGRRLLQDAAIDAVSNWRYRPYLIDGKPMQVAILVTVDFTLQP